MKYLLEIEYTVKPSGKRVTVNRFDEPQPLAVIISVMMHAAQNRWTELKWDVKDDNTIDIHELDRPPSTYRIVEVP